MKDSDYDLFDAEDHDLVKRKRFPYINQPSTLSFHQTTELAINPRSTTTFDFPATRPLRILEVAMRVLEGNPDALLANFTVLYPYHQRVLIPVDWLDARFKTTSYRQMFAATLSVGHRSEPIDIINRSDKPGRVLIVPHLKVIT